MNSFPNNGTSSPSTSMFQNIGNDASGPVLLDPSHGGICKGVGGDNIEISFRSASTVASPPLRVSYICGMYYMIILSKDPDCHREDTFHICAFTPPCRTYFESLIEQTPAEVGVTQPYTPHPNPDLMPKNGTAKAHHCSDEYSKSNPRSSENQKVGVFRSTTRLTCKKDQTTQLCPLWSRCAGSYTFADYFESRYKRIATPKAISV